MIGTRRTAGLAVATWSSLCLLACAEDAAPHADDDPAAEACEHLAEGPAQAVSAKTTDVAAELADVSKRHTRFDVTLPADVSGTYAGYVKFLAPAAGSYLLVANATVPLQVLDSTGLAVAPTAQTSVGVCPAVKTQLVYPLGVATYRVKIGPHSQPLVGLLFEAK